MKLLLTGEPVDAAEALRIGLVSELAEDEEVEPRALALAEQLAAMPVLAVRFIKEAVLQSMNGTLVQGLQFERKSFQLLFATADKNEGIRARLERRAARFPTGPVAQADPVTAEQGVTGR
jgi:enoyl-CoA hydratase